MISQAFPMTSQAHITISQPFLRTSQPFLTMSQAHITTSQPFLRTSQPHPATSQPQITFLVCQIFIHIPLPYLPLIHPPKIISANGSVQDIPEIPQHTKDIYKTVWEIKQKVIIDMAADRGAFICQSQSLNLFIQDANFGKLTSMHFYAWKKGLKTGMYYLRTKAAPDAIKFTVEKQAEPQIHEYLVGDEKDKAMAAISGTSLGRTMC